MTKEEHNKIIDFVNSEDYMLLNSYISKPYEETIIEQDKEIERLNKENKILKEALYTIWNKEIDIDYDELQKAINDIKNMQKEADKELNNGLHKMIFGSDKDE